MRTKAKKDSKQCSFRVYDLGAISRFLLCHPFPVGMSQIKPPQFDYGQCLITVIAQKARMNGHMKQGEYLFKCQVEHINSKNTTAKHDKQNIKKKQLSRKSMVQLW